VSGGTGLLLALFLFEWQGFPVGTVSISSDAQGTYRYASRHLHNREGRTDARTRQVSLRLDPEGLIAGSRARPQAAWLLSRPAVPGCTLAREELGEREGPHCVTRLTPGGLEGTMLGEPFSARYDARGALATLQLGSARFVRVLPGSTAPQAPPPDFLGRGVALPDGPGALVLSVPVATGASLPAWNAPAAVALARRVHQSFREKRPGPADFDSASRADVGGCLAHALRFQALAASHGQKAAIVHGLVVEEGRGWPHAWVRVGLPGGTSLELDPTSLAPVRAATHLRLAETLEPHSTAGAGRQWLSLFAGELRLLRVPGKK